jgi:TPR repeat protein
MMLQQIESNGAGAVPDSFFERGLACSTGREGPVDLVEAHKWFNIAAARGDRVAALHREELAGEMTREEIAAALRAARQWLAANAN